MYNSGGLVVWEFLYVRFGLLVVSDRDFLPDDDVFFSMSFDKIVSKCAESVLYSYC